MPPLDSPSQRLSAVPVPARLAASDDDTSVAGEEDPGAALDVEVSELSQERLGAGGLIDMPRPVALYLNSETSHDPELLSRCFAADAVVRDEGQTIEGIEAIKDWQARAQAKFRYTVQPLEVSGSGAEVKVRALLTGTFPGSPVELSYHFVLAGDMIRSLEIR
jgi:SnoaL-like domain